MVQYREGQRLKGSDGNIYVVQNGVPVREGGGATALAGGNPKLPGEIRGQQLNNANADVNVRVNTATEEAQIREARAKADKAEVEARAAGVENRNPAFAREQELRKEFSALPQVRDYTQAAQALGGMLRAPDTYGGDIQIIYSFVKSMSPGQVGEGELALANAGASFREQMEQKYGKLTSTNRLPPRVRQELIESARQAFAAKNQVYGQTYKYYRDLASQDGVNPERVTGPYIGDSINADERKYIEAHGGTPRSAVADANATTQTVNNDERSAFIDSMVRGGLSFEQAQSLYRDRFPDKPVFEDRESWNKAVQFAKRHPNSSGSYGQSLDTVPLSGVDQWRNWGGQTPVGEAATLYANSAAGGIPAALAGEEGQQTIEQSRGDLGYGALVPEIAGAITGTLGVNKALGAVGKAYQGAARPFDFLANNAPGRLLTSDLLYGSTYGATQNPDNPLAGAALGAGAAGVGNVVGNRVLGPGLRAGGALMGINPAPALSKADNIIAGQAQKADPFTVRGRLQDAADLNMPFALADADPRLQQIGGSVVRKSPDAYAFARESLGNRTLGQVDRLTGIVEGDMGPRLNIPTFKEGVKKTAQTKSRPLYDSAKSQPPVDDAAVNEMLRTPAGQKAARSGYDEAINNGEPVGDMVPEVDSITGEVRLVGRPSWNVLQRMKFALDEMPDQTSLARRFNGRLGQLNPDFRKANLTYAKEMRRGDIAEGGYNSANPNVRAPELQSSMASPKMMKDPTLYRQGYGSNLVNRINGMRDSANPYEVAAMASPDQLAKMQAISPSLYGRFTKARDIESTMAGTNRELFGGSPTAPRMEADKAFESGALGDALDFGFSIASGTPPISAARSQLAAGRGLFGAARDAMRLGVGNAAKKKADQLAPILFNPDAQVNLVTLDSILAAKRARDEYVRQTGMFGSGVAAPTAISLYGQR